MSQPRPVTGSLSDVRMRSSRKGIPRQPGTNKKTQRQTPNRDSLARISRMSDQVQAVSGGEVATCASGRGKWLMQWAYGITTVASRRDTLLVRTLRSLAGAGFDNPRLFVDGCLDSGEYRRQLISRYPLANALGLTARDTRIGAYPNWLLGLAELYARNGGAHRYAIFEDDFVTVLGLRQYLERTPFPQMGYLNLYTFPPGRQASPPADGTRGWFLSNQLGRSAIGLVFDRDGVQALLKDTTSVIEVPTHAGNWQGRTDGYIVEAMKASGRKEYIHHPSLTQHTGYQSTIRGKKWRGSTLALTFPGEEFDAMSLLS